MMRRNGLARVYRCGAAAVAVAAIVAVASMPAASAAGTGPAQAKAALESLKQLAGTWQGTAGPDKQPATVVYRVASGGTVVIETLFPETSHEMVTVYHLDGDDLAATHYCSQGNQPRFRLDRARSTDDTLRFEFAGGTNLDAAKDGHVHQGEIVIHGPDALSASWQFWNAGALEATLGFTLERKH